MRKEAKSGKSLYEHEKNFYKSAPKTNIQL